MSVRTYPSICSKSYVFVFVCLLLLLVEVRFFKKLEENKNLNKVKKLFQVKKLELRVLQNFAVRDMF